MCRQTNVSVAVRIGSNLREAVPVRNRHHVPVIVARRSKSILELLAIARIDQMQISIFVAGDRSELTRLGVHRLFTPSPAAAIGYASQRKRQQDNEPRAFNPQG